ncbi:hypothetical protein K432DRAFT_309501, partial [Lepidopterella palustris CBS 459.81]
MFNPSRGIKSCAGGRSPPDSSNTTTPGGNSDATSSSIQSVKRSSRDFGDDSRDGGEDDANKRPKFENRPDNTEEDPHAVRFACPFYKRNPFRQKSTACRYPGFSTVHRMKEHLYRCHILIQCKRCRQEFKNDADLEKHQREIEPCAINDSEAPEGLDMNQRMRLKSKKKFGTEVTEEEKWRAVYHFLFPDEDASSVSPYCDYDHVTSPDSRDLNEFEIFSRREYPRRVRQELESLWDSQTQPISDRLRVEFMDIVRRCQDQLFQDFQR